MAINSDILAESGAFQEERRTRPIQSTSQGNGQESAQRRSSRVNQKPLLVSNVNLNTGGRTGMNALHRSNKTDDNLSVLSSTSSHDPTTRLVLYLYNRLFVSQYGHQVSI